MIEDEMYGIIPREKSDACANAPPTNVLNKPKSEFSRLVKAPARASPSTPGIGICAPIRTMMRILTVKRILLRSSGITKTLLIFLYYFQNIFNYVIPRKFFNHQA